MGSYEDLLPILKHRKHPEHKTLKEWLGRAFDSEVIDAAKAHLRLTKLKWPRVTDTKLRKILIGRDDYQPPPAGRRHCPRLGI